MSSCPAACSSPSIGRSPPSPPIVKFLRCHHSQWKTRTAMPVWLVMSKKPAHQRLEIHDCTKVQCVFFESPHMEIQRVMRHDTTVRWCCTYLPFAASRLSTRQSLTSLLLLRDIDGISNKPNLRSSVQGSVTANLGLIVRTTRRAARCRLPVLQCLHHVFKSSFVASSTVKLGVRDAAVVTPRFQLNT